MYQVNIFLPLKDNAGTNIPQESFQQVKTTLVKEFGGLTAFTRSPAEGLWAEGSDAKQKDDIVIFEVITGKLDETWWRTYRKVLEQIFKQEKILVVVHAVSVF